MCWIELTWPKIRLIYVDHDLVHSTQSWNVVDLTWLIFGTDFGQLNVKRHTCVSVVSYYFLIFLILNQITLSLLMSFKQT